MDCKEAVYSEDYYDLIIEYGSIGANTSVIQAGDQCCVQYRIFQQRASAGFKYYGLYLFRHPAVLYANG